METLPLKKAPCSARAMGSPRGPPPLTHPIPPRSTPSPFRPKPQSQPAPHGWWTPSTWRRGSTGEVRGLPCHGTKSGSPAARPHLGRHRLGQIPAKGPPSAGTPPFQNTTLGAGTRLRRAFVFICRCRRGFASPGHLLALHPVHCPPPIADGMWDLCKLWRLVKQVGAIAPTPLPPAPLSARQWLMNQLGQSDEPFVPPNPHSLRAAAHDDHHAMVAECHSYADGG